MARLTGLYALMPPMYGPRAPLGICRGFFVSISEVHELSLAPTREQTVMNCLRDLDWLPLHLEVKVNICVQVHKRSNVRSPGYMSDLLVLNSDINERNNRNNSLNLLCPPFKREIEGGGGERGRGRTFGVRAARLWNAVSNSLNKIQCVHSSI